MIYVYPAIFTPYTEDDGDKYVLVHFPDLNISTEGSDIAHAAYMAKDALEMMLVEYENNNIEFADPTPTFSSIESSGYDDVSPEKSFCSMVIADTEEWRKQNDNRAIRKNCSIPAWLNRKAELVQAPFSQLLQNALMEYLKIDQQVSRNL